MAKQAKGNETQIDKKHNNHAGLIVCILLCLTALTSALVVIGLYQVKEADHVIVLTGEQAEMAASGVAESVATDSATLLDDGGFSGTNASATASSDFIAYDDDVTWTTDTSVEIFHLSYDNEKGDITVTSDGEDAVFAPGTSNSYTFHLKNNGDTSLDYSMWMESSVSNEEYALPITVRLQSSEGEWILGGEDTWVDAAELNSVFDSATLGASRYVWYTLEWQWPFESGADEYDTLLGNMAVEEDLSLTITIYTRAEIADETATNEDGTTTTTKTIGSRNTKTGDDTPLMAVVLLGLAAAFVCILLIWRKRKKRGA